MFDYKTIWAIVGVALAVVSYIIYFKQIFAGKTKPHAFSWFVWGLLTTIAFVAQIMEGAGPGAWVTGSTTIACFAVFFLALFKGEKSFSKFDWLALGTACMSIIFWWLSDDPTLSVILVTTIDALGFLPTFRKSYYKPYEEGVALYAFSAVRYVFGLLALESISLSTWLFPASLVITNGLFVLMVLVRRKKIKG